MEFEIFTHADNRTLEVQVSGRTNLDYFLEMIKVVISEIDNRKFKRVIYHNRNADSTALTVDDLKVIARETKKLNQVLAGGKLAAVIENKLSYGLVRMWHTFSSNDLTYQFELFNNHQSALNWLNS